MKTYKIIAILLLAVTLCLGMIACGPSDKKNESTPTENTPGSSEPTVPTLHYAESAAVSEETMKGDLVKLLNLPEGTAVDVEGTFDLGTAGKYDLTCKWGEKEEKVAVWVYSNFVTVSVDGKRVQGDKVNLQYQKAVASENFTKCITITDSLGNALAISKDERCMSFEDRAGSYLMYYNVTDAAGQTFTVRMVYIVTYDHQISVSNAPAFTFEEVVEIPADFDGVSDVWLEDDNGKIDTDHYQIKENAILLNKSYYASFVGKRISLKACSEYSNSYFYLTVYDEASYSDYIEKTFLQIISFKDSSVTFHKVTESVDGVDFERAYRYTKAADVGADDAQLTLETMGNYGKVSFNLYVKSATGGASGDGVMEFQITKGARFISVTDTDGNSVAPIEKNDMPHVMLDEGKVYRIVIDFTEALRCTFRVWGAKAVEIYYYNFGTEAPVFEYVIDSAQKSILCKKDGEKFGYFAWPTVTKLDGDRLIAVSSGFRQAHIDPEGKVVGWFSEDGGKTWSEPQVLADTVLDDRDSGVVYWNGKIIVSWFCASKVYYINNNPGKYSAWAAGIDDALDTKLMGGNYIISEDGGKTWSQIYNMPEGMFTPHGLIVNPDGGLTSVGYLKYDKVNKTWGTGIGVRTTDGTMNSEGFVWSDAIVIATDKEQNEKTGWDFQEPYGIYNDEGVLIVVMRSVKGLFQCELQPGAEKFSDWHMIARVQETPAHMFRHSSGVLVMTYGYRGIYRAAHAPNTTLAPNSTNDVMGVRARLSYDGGMTWTDERILTTDGEITDLGYSSSVELSDGKILTVFYQRGEKETMASIYQVLWELPEAPTGEKTIQFYTGDGSKVASISGQVGDAIMAPEDPTLAGKTFGGWYLDSACTIPFTFTTFSRDLTLFAQWN